MRVTGYAEVVPDLVVEVACPSNTTVKSMTRP